MFDGHQKTALEKKAYEIAYALFRVSASVAERGIAEKLKEEGFRVLEAVVVADHAKAQNSLNLLDYILKFSMDLNVMNIANGEILIKEIGGAQALIAECASSKENDVVDISSFFSKPLVDASQNISARDFFSQEKVAVSRAEEYGNESQPERVDVQGGGVENKSPESNSSIGVFLKSGMRQIAILDKIRQSGNCRLRDIQEVLPDASERTIRYDLETLIERKQIERTGNGGPSVSYRMRQ